MPKKPVAPVIKTLAPCSSGQSDCVRESTPQMSSAMIGWVAMAAVVVGHDRLKPVLHSGKC